MKRSQTAMAFVLLFGFVFLSTMRVEAVVKLPVYQPEQLKDQAYVSTELEKYSQLRKDLREQIGKSNDIRKASLQSDLERVGIVLDALNYIKAHGYDPADPELKKLAYFNFKVNTLPVVVSPPIPEPPKLDVVYDAGDKTITQPKPISAPQLIYSPDLIGKDGLHGELQIEFIVDEKGVPTEVKVKKEFLKEIDEGWVDNIKNNWRFEPGLKNGQPVKVHGVLPIKIDVEPPKPGQAAPSKEGTPGGAQ